MDLHKKEIPIFSDHLEIPTAPIFAFSVDESLEFELMDKATIESRMAEIDAKIVASANGEQISFDYNSLNNKPDLTRYVEKEVGKELFSGSYNDLLNVPENFVYTEDLEQLEMEINLGLENLTNSHNENITNINSKLETSTEQHTQDINNINIQLETLSNNIETLTNQHTEDITKLADEKVNKIEGKGLSTEDFTTEEKNKLATLITYGTEDLVAGSSQLATGTIYIVYE